MITLQTIDEAITRYPNYKGQEHVTFLDIQWILSDNSLFNALIDLMLEKIGNEVIQETDYFTGIEARGFIFATALAQKTGKGIKLVRKAGKLPNPDLIHMEYGLEYGIDAIEMARGEGNIVLADDLIATGGTLAAAQSILKEAGYNCLDTIVAIDLTAVPRQQVVAAKAVLSYDENLQLIKD